MCPATGEGLQASWSVNDKTLWCESVRGQGGQEASGRAGPQLQKRRLPQPGPSVQRVSVSLSHRGGRKKGPVTATSSSSYSSSPQAKTTPPKHHKKLASATGKRDLPQTGTVAKKKLKPTSPSSAAAASPSSSGKRDLPQTGKVATKKLKPTSLSPAAAASSSCCSSSSSSARAAASHSASSSHHAAPPEGEDMAFSSEDEVGGAQERGSSNTTGKMPLARQGGGQAASSTQRSSESPPQPRQQPQLRPVKREDPGGQGTGAGQGEATLSDDQRGGTVAAGHRSVWAVRFLRETLCRDRPSLRRACSTFSDAPVHLPGTYCLARVEVDKVDQFEAAVFRKWATAPPGPDKEVYWTADSLLREVRTQ